MRCALFAALAVALSLSAGMLQATAGQITGAGKVYGMAGAEKSVATILYNYAGKNGPALMTKVAQ